MPKIDSHTKRQITNNANGMNDDVFLLSSSSSFSSSLHDVLISMKDPIHYTLVRTKTEDRERAHQVDGVW